MSTIKANTVTTLDNDADLTITGGGTGVPNLEAGTKLNGTALTSTFLSTSANIPNVAPGTSGNLVTSNGSAWTSAAPAALSANVPNVAPGTSGNLVTSNGSAWTSAALSANIPNVAPGTSGNLVTSNGSAWTSAALSANIPNVAPGTSGNVVTSNGSAWTSAAAAASGKVLQVVTAATSTEATTTSGTYADTNLTAAITPANSSNKILVLISQSISSVGGRAGGALRILRGSTEVEEYNQISNVENQFGQHFIQHLDSPSSTSATTYHTEFKRIDQSGTVTAQRNDSSGNATSTITLIEIGA